ncbi:MAG: (2Fe-2S)-binding protein [Myxococcales bacterium]|nr:(2Fe-2S)-binding protein [Myxococcales bacterium]
MSADHDDGADRVWFEPPPRSVRLPMAPPTPAPATITLEIDGREVQVADGSSLLDACASIGIETPTLCFLKTLTPVNACRVCVVELEGSRTLVPSCARKAEAGMKVHTDSPRVRLSRKLVLELLGSSVDLSQAPDVARWMARYDAHPERFGADAATVAQPVKDDNDLYVRDYARCILCYKCVEACGTDAQNTFAIAVAGRGFDARVATEADVPLPASACVYCGNCIGVCPTNALVFKSEHVMRGKGTWAPERQTTTDTICSYCGVGCTLTLHAQDGRIVKVTSPLDASVTEGNLCIKGRFGFDFVDDEPAGDG